MTFFILYGRGIFLRSRSFFFMYNICVFGSLTYPMTPQIRNDRGTSRRATDITFSSSPEKDGLKNTIFSTLRLGGGVRDT